MEILGIGPSELLFIIIIALIVLGPKDMQKTGRTVGRWLNNLVRSDSWKTFQQTSKEIRNLPTRLMREANMELAETEKNIQKALDVSQSRPASSSYGPPLRSQKAENTIQPPSDKPTETDTVSNEEIS